MIHDDLTRHFARTPQPSLTPEFGMNLRRRLRATTPQRRLYTALLPWAPRLYWITAIGALAYYWRPPSLTPMQIAVLAVGAAAIGLTLRRAFRPGPLRALRDSLRF